jgi:opacity protein-like surface antigen
MIKHSAVAGLALALVAGSAFAADLPYRKAPIVEPPPPVFTWTGLYGGINIGYGFGNSTQDPGALVNYPYTYHVLTTDTVAPTFTINPAATGWWIPNDLSGVLGGGQVGANYQFNPWLVVGIEADVQAADIHSQGNGVGGATNNFPLGAQSTYATQNKSVDWFGTVRGRVGVTIPSFPNLLVYGTAGLAYGNVIHSVNVSGFYPSLATGFAGAVIGAGTNYDQTKVGWTAGGGVEWFPLPTHALFKAFSVKLEYLYTDLGSTTLYGSSIASVPANLPGFAYQQSSATRWSTVRLGVNWHFNPFVSAPVLAKY